MLKKLQLSIISILFATFSFADVFMTELTDPHRIHLMLVDMLSFIIMVILADLSAGWTVQRWTENGNADPTA